MRRLIFAGMLAFASPALAGGPGIGPGSTPDPANAPYIFSPANGSPEGSSAASYTFSAATLKAMKSIFAVCPAQGGTFMPVDIYGASPGVALPLPPGWTPSIALNIKGWTANSGCYFGANF